jgi:putative membrane protein
MRSMLARLIALAVGFALMVVVVPGISRGSAGSILASALIYMVVNATAGRVLKVVTAPLALLTLGLSVLAINLVVLVFTAWLVKGLDIDGIRAAILGTIWLTVVSLLVNFVLRRLFDRADRRA